MKKVKIFAILGIIFSVIVLSLVIFLANNRKNDALKFKDEYELLNGNDSVNVEISNDNPIKYVTLDETIDILEKKTGVIYFGFPSCPWCRNILPILFEVAKENKVDTIYYFNPREEKENYSKLLEILDNYLETDSNGEKKLYVPDVYFIKDGKIVGNHLGSVDSQENPYVPLTDEQKQELKEIYQKLFDLI